MNAYFITGNAGTGKSTVIQELARRGYNALDIDERSDIHGYLDTQTNTVIDVLPTMNAHGIRAFERYRSILKGDGLRELLNSKGTIFLGGSVTNQEQFYALFKSVFALALDNSHLESRLANRTNNPTGNDPTDRAYLVSINERVQANLQNAGAIVIDAKQSSTQVADEILGHVYDSTNLA